VCGICIGFGNNIVIEGNRIQNNGRKLAGAGSSRFGIPGGIIVFFAGVAAGVPEEPDEAASTSLEGNSLRVLNNVVEQGNGLALGARATGPVAIEGNFFESRGNNNPTQLPNTTYTVLVINTGLPWESVALPTGEPNPARWNFGTPAAFATKRTTLIADALTKDTTEAAGPFGQGGQVLFNNNHVTLKFVTERNVPPGVIQGVSVSIGSLDDVVMAGNQLAMNVENPTLKKKTVAGNAPNQPPMTANAVIVGQSANVSGNRIAEGVWDSTISLITVGGLLASSTSNVSTHKQFVANAQSVPAGGNVFLPPPGPPTVQFIANANNLEWFIPVNDAIFPFGGLFTNPIANVIINSMCRFFLELPVDDLTTPTPTP
jgi:hypothetical protein